MTAVTSLGTAPRTAAGRLRWVALAVVCAGSLMNVLDTTIVGVALPAIRQDLGFSPVSLAWVVNAYLLPYGGCMLLGGRLGDLFGHRRLFTAGIAVFTLASLACGLAADQGMLLAARAIQGLGGAVVTATALSLVVSLFPEPGGRARAMGVFGFVSAGGGSIGVLAGGILTGLASWHWIFLVNIPIGVAVWVTSLRVLPRAPGGQGRGRLDARGALLATGAVLAGVYGITRAGQAGWTSGLTIAALAAAVLLAAAFAAAESRTAFPLVPLGLLRVRNLLAASAIGMLWTAGMFAMFFLTTLYLQLVLGYSPLRTGLAFLPTNLLMAAISVGVSARLVARLGTRIPLAGGLLLAAAGLALLGHAPAAGHFTTDLLPGMILLGIGAGTALTPLLLAATSAVAPADAGLASGIANTSFMLGGALGLAVLAGLAAGRTRDLLSAGQPQLAALTGGYHIAYLTGAGCAALAGLLAATWLRPAPAAPAPVAAPRAAEPELVTSTGPHH
ncbi:MAG TPA: MFS transporter [Streptosporangiaceae bacterium]|jgi:EmrB/QacA subfamily drug resistance transporter